MTQLRKNIAGLGIALGLFLGCSGSQNAPAANEPPSKPTTSLPTPQPVEPIFSMNLPAIPKQYVKAGCSVFGKGEVDAFSCVRTACKTAGGNFNEAEKECQCGPNQVFSALNGGKCLTFAVNEDCSNLFQRSKEARESCFSKLGTLDQKTSIKLFLLDDKKPVESEEGEEETEEELLSPSTEVLIARLAVLASEGRMAPKLWSFPLPDSLNVISGPGKLSEETIKQLLIGDRFDPIVLMPTRPVFLYEADPEKIPEAIGVLPLKDTDHLKGSATKNSAGISLAEAYSFTRTQGYNPKPSTLATQDGCAGLCEMNQVIPDLGGGYYVGKWIKQYAGGVVFRNIVTIHKRTPSSRTEAMLVLNAAGGISLYATFEAREVDKVSKIIVRTFDRKSKEIASPFELSLNYSSKDTGLRDIAKLSRFSPNVPGAIFCEAETEPQLLAKHYLLDSLQTGPHSESFFGWLANEAKSPSLQYDGLKETGRSGLPIYSDSSHSLNVTKAFVGDKTNVRFSYLGYESCFARYSEWKPSVRQANFKVVNMSFADIRDKVACENSSFGEALQDKEKPFLFVAAAGNVGIAAPHEYFPACPQAMSGSDNLIVVAASVKEGVSRMSTHGYLFADIATDGSVPGVYNEPPATSFAAPKVSRVAADIAAQYPELSVADIRSAILYSADWQIKDNKPGILPVRSGGTLNPERAKSIAKAISKARKNGKLDISKILQKEFCVERDYFAWERNYFQEIKNGSCPYADKKLEWLSKPEIGLLK